MIDIFDPQEARILREGRASLISIGIEIKELPSRYDGQVSKHTVFSWGNGIFANPTTSTVWIDGSPQQAHVFFSPDRQRCLFRIPEQV